MSLTNKNLVTKNDEKLITWNYLEERAYKVVGVSID